jgi:hypothetical protein
MPSGHWGKAGATLLESSGSRGTLRFDPDPLHSRRYSRFR